MHTGPFLLLSRCALGVGSASVFACSSRRPWWLARGPWRYCGVPSNRRIAARYSMRRPMNSAPLASLNLTAVAFALPEPVFQRGSQKF